MAKSGNSNAIIEGRINTQGRAVAKVSLQTNGTGSKAEINATSSTIQRQPTFKADAAFGLSLGAALLQGSVSHSKVNGATSTEAGLSIKSGDFTFGVEVNKKEIKRAGSFGKSF